MWPGILFLVPLAFALAPTALAQGANASGDMYLVERPSRLLIYNKFQQPTSAQERRALLPFTPMLILKSSDVLGDGFTPCTKVQIGNELYYLIRGEDGSLVGSPSAGYSHVFSRVPLVNDTLRVLRDRRLKLTSPGRGSNRLLRKDETMARVFRDGGSWYVWTSGPPPSYGWVALDNRDRGSVWDVFTSVPATKGPTISEVIRRVEVKIEETNGILSKLFRYMNTQVGDQRTIPHWTVSQTGTTIVCVFSDQRLASRYEQSTRILEKDIQTSLNGTEYETLRSTGRIEIRPK